MKSVAKFLGRRVKWIRTLHEELVVRRAQVIELEDKLARLNGHQGSIKSKHYTGLVASNALVDEIEKAVEAKDEARLNKDKINSRMEALEADSKQLKIDLDHQKTVREALSREIVLANLTISALKKANAELLDPADRKAELFTSEETQSPSPAKRNASAKPKTTAKPKAPANSKPKSEKRSAKAAKSLEAKPTGPAKKSDPKPSTNRRKKAPVRKPSTAKKSDTVSSNTRRTRSR